MARTPLSISTRGRITTVARNTLTIAVIGWLVAAGSPIQQPPPSMGHAGGYLGSGVANYDIVENRSILENKHREKILKEDEEILMVIKKYMDYRTKN